MAKFAIYDLKAAQVGELELADDVFDAAINKQILYDAIVHQRASWRQGTHDVKNRSEVSGGGKKPFRQKGTGRARQGSRRAVQFKGGGVAFGPTPRTYTTKLNRKVRRAALKMALSFKAQSNDLVIVNDLAMDRIKTKDFVKVMEAFHFERKTLFVVDLSEDFDNAFMSLRNLGNVAMVEAGGINVYDLSDAHKLVLTKAAAKQIEEALSNE